MRERITGPPAAAAHRGVVTRMPAGAWMRSCGLPARGADYHAAAGVRGGTERLPSNANSADRDATRSTTLCAEMPIAAVAAAARFWPSAPTVLPRRRRPDAERPLLLLLRARQASVSSSMRHTPAVDELGARGEGRQRFLVTIAFTLKAWPAPAGSGSVWALPREDQHAADE